MLTPYQYASNRPVDGIDVDGQEFMWYLAAEKFEELYLGSTRLRDRRIGFVNRGAETIHGLIQLPAAAQQINHAIRQDLGAVQRLCPTADCGTPPMKMAEITITILHAMYADYKDLIVRAANGDDEAIGGLAFEAAAFLLPFDEARFASKGRVLGSFKTIRTKFRKAISGDLPTAAEIRVAKMLRNEGEHIRFIDETSASRTPEFRDVFSNRGTEVKRISGLGRKAAGDLAKGVTQAGDGGRVIVVRPSDSKFSLQQYTDFVDGFKPQIDGRSVDVEFRVVNEAELPNLKK